MYIIYIYIYIYIGPLLGHGLLAGRPEYVLHDGFAVQRRQRSGDCRIILLVIVVVTVMISNSHSNSNDMNCSNSDSNSNNDSTIVIVGPPECVRHDGFAVLRLHRLVRDDLAGPSCSVQ